MGSTTARTFSYNRPAGAGAERLGSTAPLHVYGTWGDRRDDGIRRIRPGASQPPPVETCAHRRDRAHRGYLFNGATSRSDGALVEVLGGTLCRGCPPASVALVWRALLPGTAGEAVAQEGFAQLEVALPSSLTHVAMIGSRQ